MAALKLDRVNKQFSRGVKALDDVSLDISDGEFVAVVGPSGCGKTTALRIIAGLEEPTSGAVLIGDRDVTAAAPGDRDVAMVFQNYALYPHMSVFGNLAFGLRARHTPKAEVAQQVRTIADVLGLTEMLARKPRMLSGGQRQRVAMGRALVRQPRAFLMDEPLSNLDAQMRAQMRGEVVRIQKEFGTTTVYVTHDQVEAMTMGDRVAVIRDGVIQQFDTPKRLYEAPANASVAGFLGSPPMNTVMARVESTTEGVTCAIGESRIHLDNGQLSRVPALREYVGRSVLVGVRPDDIGLAEPGVPTGRPTLRGRVFLTEVLGSEYILHVELPDSADSAQPREEDDDAGSAVGSRKVRAKLRGSGHVGLDDAVDLVLPPEHLHFFDASTGAALQATR